MAAADEFEAVELGRIARTGPVYVLVVDRPHDPLAVVRTLEYHLAAAFIHESDRLAGLTLEILNVQPRIGAGFETYRLSGLHAHLHIVEHLVGRYREVTSASRRLNRCLAEKLLIMFAIRVIPCEVLPEGRRS